MLVNWVQAVSGLGIPIKLSGGGPRSRRSPPDTAHQATAGLSAVRAYCGTEGSNPPHLRRQLEASRDYIFTAAGIPQDLFRSN
jgi:hypothetical protein